MGIAEARETIRACRYCFMCRFACPTFLATKREAVTPRGYGLLLMAIDEGKQVWTADIVSVFYQCSMCGLCSEHCEYDWPEDEMVRQARAEIVSTGHAPSSAMVAADAFLGNSIPWAEGISLPRDRCNPDVLYLAGCQTRQHNPEIIAATTEVFTALGIQWSVLGDESCCGGGLYDLGYPIEARQKASNLADQIIGLNPGTVVTGCAHCYRSLTEFYPAWGAGLPEGIQVLHMAEFLNKMAFDGKLKLDGMGDTSRLGYHDPCMLGRKVGMYDLPRRLIETAVGHPPIELFHNKELAECCGAGAAAYLVEPGVARSVARIRLERASEAGVSTLVTACQNCKLVLQGAAGLDGIQVLDLIELIAQHLG